MQDDRVRMEHEAALIRLRENALKEKMQAQLEWIELQKINAQKKGKKGEDNADNDLLALGWYVRSTESSKYCLTTFVRRGWRVDAKTEKEANGLVEA